MSKDLYKVVFHTGYIPDMDITVIFKSLVDTDSFDFEFTVSDEIVGWYHGQPSENLTETYKELGLKAIYD